MTAGPAAPEACDALLAAALLAVDPAGLGGAVLRAAPGPERDAWLAALRGMLPEGAPWGRAPPGVADDRLLGGLDLTASLAAGRPVVERGLLAASDGGVVVMAMAERLEAGVAARLSTVLDSGEVALERDGLADRHAARLGLVLLDEGIEPDERPPAALTERLAFRPDLARLGRGQNVPAASAEDVAAARDRLATVAVSDAAVEALCAAADAFGLASVRPPLLALRAAQAHAALHGHTQVEQADLAAAVRLVLLPRAVTIPTVDVEEEEAAPPPEAPTPDEGRGEEPQDHQTEGPDPERVLEAAQAVLPEGLLERIVAANQRSARDPRRSGAGEAAKSARRGRPAGSRPGRLSPGDRLDLPATLRAAAPWARLRQASEDQDHAPSPRSSRRKPGPLPGVRLNATPTTTSPRAWVPALAGMNGGEGGDQGVPRRVPVRTADLRIRRFVQRRESTTIVVVDASGSAAFQRLAEAKGAVELLLAKAYVTRSRVALVAFRDAGAQVLLEPTRSLTRARRSLADLPGGGGTPLAHGLDLALDVARAETAHNRTPLLVVLTDGRANVARDGSGGRAAAERDALAAAARVREARVGAAWLDTSARPRTGGDRFAQAMGAAYAPLPYADPARVTALVAELRGGGR